jgi:hypothetical protein
MILETFEISDDMVDEIVVCALKRTMRVHINGTDPDSSDIVAACNKLIDYYTIPPKEAAPAPVGDHD